MFNSLLEIMCKSSIGRNNVNTASE